MLLLLLCHTRVSAFNTGICLAKQVSFFCLNVFPVSCTNSSLILLSGKPGVTPGHPAFPGLQGTQQVGKHCSWPQAHITSIQVFREQGIDGETLPLLTEEHLLTTMGLKLGPALKIRAQVSTHGSGGPQTMEGQHQALRG